MTAWDFLKDLNTVCSFMSREGAGKATNLELKRWLQNKAILINGTRPNWDDVLSFPIESLVMFPKKNKTTIW